MAETPHRNEISEKAALYCLGKLTPEQSRQFEQQLASGCAVCNAELQACEAVTSYLPFALDPVPPPPSLRQRLLERIHSMQKPALPEGGIVVRANEGAWMPMPVPGVKLRVLKSKETMLVRMEPGASYPAHDHHQAEQCLVLEGTVSSDGLTVSAGDYTYMPAGSSHQPLYTETGCLLLIAYSG